MTRPSKPSLRSKLVGLIGLLLLASAGAAGWRSWSGLTVADVRVEGQEIATADEILALARVESGIPLSTVDPLVTADRVRRHPWVEEARAARQPTGHVLVDVTERVPVALALNQNGDPAYYIDRNGYRMPFVTGHGFEVPLVRGIRSPYRATVPLKSTLLLDLLAALPDLDPEIDALVSEFRLEAGDILVTTVPTPSGRSLTANLGDTAFASRLGRLHAFWHQAVLPRPHARFDWIDLRFDNQIVTRERA